MSYRETRRNEPNKSEEEQKRIPVICPNCGKTIEIEARAASTLCSYCQSALRPTRESLASYYAQASHLKAPLLLTDIPKGYLRETQESDHFDLNSLGVLSLQSSFGQLHANVAGALPQRSREELRTTHERSITEVLRQLSEIANLVLSVPNDKWIIQYEKTSFGQMDVFLHTLIVHDNGKCTVVTLSQRLDDQDLAYDLHKLKGAPNIDTVKESMISDVRYHYLDIRLTRLNSVPTSEKELQSALHTWSSEDNALFDCSSTLSLYSGIQVEPSTLESKMFNNPAKPGYVQLANEFDHTIAQIRTSLYQKIEDSQSLPTEKRNGFLDRPREAHPILHVEKLDQESLAVTLECSSCGRQIEGYNGRSSFAKCSACGAYNDVVDRKKLPSFLLESIKPSDTFIPAEYLIQLISDQDASGKALEIMQAALDSQAHGRGDNYTQILQFADIITKIGIQHPQLFSHYNYLTQEYGFARGYDGAVSFIEFPNTSIITHTDSKGHSSLRIPSEFRGKVLCITFGDYGNDAPYSQEEWYRMDGTIFNRKNFDDRFSSLADWGKQHRNADQEEQESHWLENLDIPLRNEEYGDARKDIYGIHPSVLAEIPSEGELFKRIHTLLQKLPQEQELGNQIDRKKRRQ